MFEILLYTLAALGVLFLAAAYQDSKIRSVAKKAGTPIAHPSLLTLLAQGLSGLMAEFTKPKKPKSKEVV